MKKIDEVGPFITPIFPMIIILMIATHFMSDETKQAITESAPSVAPFILIALIILVAAIFKQPKNGHESENGETKAVKIARTWGSVHLIERAQLFICWAFYNPGASLSIHMHWRNFDKLFMFAFGHLEDEFFFDWSVY